MSLEFSWINSLQIKSPPRILKAESTTELDIFRQIFEKQKKKKKKKNFPEIFSLSF